MSSVRIDLGELRAHMQEQGFTVFESTKYEMNLNLIAIRNMDHLRSHAGAEEDDTFECTFVAMFPQKEDGDDCVSFGYRAWPCTTIPGIYYLKNPINREGTGIIAKGQYPGSHQIGIHGVNNEAVRHRALVQRGTIQIYRDTDMDGVPEMVEGTKRDSNFEGFNIHRGSRWRVIQNIRRWSAGCIVLPDPDHHAVLMGMAQEAVDSGWKNSFTLTLIEPENYGSIVKRV